MPGLLETMVLDHLRPRAPNRWWLPPVFQRRIAGQLRVAFTRFEVPLDEVTRLLKLIAVFEEEAAYAEVAETLIEILQSIPAAVARFEALRGRAVVDERQREVLSRFVAEERAKRAPQIDREPLIGVRLKDLCPSVDRERMRARSSRAARPGG